MAPMGLGRIVVRQFFRLGTYPQAWKMAKGILLCTET
jgi:hypothetical protein